MHFLTVLGHTLQTKNKLEQAVLKHLQGYSRTLINHINLARHKRTLIQNVAGFNAEYPRCKPIILDWSTGHECKLDVILRTNFATFYFYAEKPKQVQ
jgi:hypothetical protein